MKLMTNVNVVQVLTEASKEKLKMAFSSRIQQLEKEIGQLQFERKRLEKKRKYPEYRLQQYFDREINNRKEKIELLEFQKLDNWKFFLRVVRSKNGTCRRSLTFKLVTVGKKS